MSRAAPLVLAGLLNVRRGSVAVLDSAKLVRRNWSLVMHKGKKRTGRWNSSNLLLFCLSPLYPAEPREAVVRFQEVKVGGSETSTEAIRLAIRNAKPPEGSI
jgi:hypothetical protein